MRTCPKRHTPRSLRRDTHHFILTPRATKGPSPRSDCRIKGRGLRSASEPPPDAPRRRHQRYRTPWVPPWWSSGAWRVRCSLFPAGLIICPIAKLASGEPCGGHRDDFVREQAPVRGVLRQRTHRRVGLESGALGRRMQRRHARLQRTSPRPAKRRPPRRVDSSTGGGAG